MLQAVVEMDAMQLLQVRRPLDRRPQRNDHLPVGDHRLQGVQDRLSPRLALERQVNALPPGERKALELRVIDEPAYDQVAEKLDIRPTAARLRVSRALRRLSRTAPKEET